MSYAMKMCGCGRGSVYALGLCHKCYLVRWKLTTTAPIPHGTRTGYATRGCRCDLCSQAHRLYMQAYAAKKKAEQ